MTQTIAPHPLEDKPRERNRVRNLRSVGGCFAGMAGEFDRWLHDAAKPQSHVAPYQRSIGRLASLPAEMNASRCAFTLQRAGASRAATAFFTGRHLQLEPVMKLTESRLGSRFVTAIDRAGLPLANIPLTFEVLRGTGSINPATTSSTTTTTGTGSNTVTTTMPNALSGANQPPTKPDGVNPARRLLITTDANGRAAVWFTLGKQSGEAGNMVQVSASDANAANATIAANPSNTSSLRGSCSAPTCLFCRDRVQTIHWLQCFSIPVQNMVVVTRRAARATPVVSAI